MSKNVFVRKLFALFLVGVLALSLTGCRRSYSVGEVDGTTYTNKWAEVKVSLPSDYVMMDKSQMGRVSNGFEVACVFCKNNATKVPLCAVMTREGDVDINQIGEEFTQEFGGTGGSTTIQQGGTTVQVTINKEYYTIAGESFLCFHMSLSVGDVYCAFREIDDTGVFAICVVTLTGGDESEEDIFNMFKEL